MQFFLFRNLAPSSKLELYAVRNKRLRGSTQSLSAITAALQSEEEDSDLEDDTGDDSMEEEPDNPRWHLYNAVRNATNAAGDYEQKFTRFYFYLFLMISCFGALCFG